jgi:hypothetical protein
MSSATLPSELAPGQRISLRASDGRQVSVLVEDIGEAFPTADQLPESAPSSVSHPRQFSNNQKAIGATAGGAIIGTLIAGPIVGIILGGAALYATTRDDKVGESARGFGTAAMAAYERACELAQEHKVGERVSAAASATANRLNEIVCDSRRASS